MSKELMDRSDYFLGQLYYFENDVLTKRFVTYFKMCEKLKQIGTYNHISVDFELRR